MSQIVFVGMVVLGLMVGGPADAPDGSKGKPPAAQVEKAPVCPKIYAPVICDNGKTYPNQCVADRHHAQNCVPVGL